MHGQPHFLDQVCEQIRMKHYSIRTERVYCEWVERSLHSFAHAPGMGLLRSMLLYPVLRCVTVSLLAIGAGRYLQSCRPAAFSRLLPVTTD